MTDLHTNLWARLRAFNDEMVEAQERLLLLNRPWEEELLHWTPDGRLHGHLTPACRGRRSVTSSGWCPGASSC